jgi:hypothetical protein
VNPETAGDSGEGQSYNVEVMDTAVNQVWLNRSV